MVVIPITTLKGIFKMSEMKKLTGLWLNETKNGEKYFSGSLGFLKMLIFKNKYKETENHPDYLIYLAPKEEKKTEDEPVKAEDDNDDLPF